MEPLLVKLAREFTDSQDLSDRLMRLYKVRHAMSISERSWRMTIQTDAHIELPSANLSYFTGTVEWILMDLVHADHRSGRLRRPRQPRVLLGNAQAGVLAGAGVYLDGQVRKG